MTVPAWQLCGCNLLAQVSLSDPQFTHLQTKETELGDLYVSDPKLYYLGNSLQSISIGINFVSVLHSTSL